MQSAEGYIKRSLLALCAMIMLGGSLSAQSFRIGTKAPDLSGLDWLTEHPAEIKRTTLVEFFHSNNKNSAERLDWLRGLAVENAEQLNVVIIIRDDDHEALRMLAENREYYYVVQTDARFLRSIGVRYVPYTYITKDELKHTPDFFDFNVKLNYNFVLNEHLKIQLNGGVQNMFNAFQKDLDKGTYRDSGYFYGPTQPRTYFIGIKLFN